MAARARVLSTRDLNRALLARQLLLSRAALPLPRALERVGGLQAQYAPSMYIGLWSRVEGFRRDDLTAALERRQVVQGTLMRSTIHLVSAADYWPFAAAIREARRRWWSQVAGRAVDPAAIEAAAARLRERLAEGPLRRTEIDRLLGKPLSAGIGLWLDMVRVPPSGTWERRRADLYAAADDWLGPAEATPSHGVELLVRRYLGGFGPATAAEVANWAGLPVPEVAAAFERLRLRRFRSEEGEELVDLPGAPLPPAETPAPVRFLPTWDAILLVHARRKAVLAEEHRTVLFTSRNPHSEPTFMVDGRVAGTWRHEGGRVRAVAFEPLPRSVDAEVREEAGRLAALHA